MADKMDFPNTVEEFMEQYKVVDTDGVFMSKGSELVPIFRMKQWFEHLPSAQPEQRWIPCSERFPDKEMPVWVSMCDDDVLKAIWRDGWCAPNGYKMGLTDGQVIAWMPRQTIPETYKEEGE